MMDAYALTYNHFYRSIPSLAEVLEAVSKLRELGASVIEITTSERGNPVLGILIGRGGTRLAVVAGQHGSEPAPVLASTLFVYRLLKDDLRPRLSRREVLDKATILVVPLANPDGFEVLKPCLDACGAPSWRCECVEARLTARMEDLNRDWLWLKHNATRGIHHLINDLDPHVVLDLHEFYARKGSPPRWAHEVEGFDAYVTDAPYLGVSPEISYLSLSLAKRVKEAIESSTGWVTRIVRPGNGLTAYPPIYLGTHVPMEGSAKLLIETWGVGLGSYLLYERVVAHVEAIAEVVRSLLDDVKLVEEVKKMDREYDRIVGEAVGGRYVVRGRDVGEAKRVLSSHRIRFEDHGDHVVVEMPQRYSRTTLFLLDREYLPNRELVRRGREALLDSYLEVEVEKE